MPISPSSPLDLRRRRRRAGCRDFAGRDFVAPDFAGLGIDTDGGDGMEGMEGIEGMVGIEIDGGDGTRWRIAVPRLMSLRVMRRRARRSLRCRRR
jgi:hypothetical protein